MVTPRALGAAGSESAWVSRSEDMLSSGREGASLASGRPIRGAVVSVPGDEAAGPVIRPGVGVGVSPQLGAVPVEGAVV